MFLSKIKIFKTYYLPTKSNTTPLCNAEEKKKHFVKSVKKQTLTTCSIKLYIYNSLRWLWIMFWKEKKIVNFFFIISLYTFISLYCLFAVQYTVQTLYSIVSIVEVYSWVDCAEKWLQLCDIEVNCSRRRFNL